MSVAKHYSLPENPADFRLGCSISMGSTLEITPQSYKISVNQTN